MKTPLRLYLSVLTFFVIFSVCSQGKYQLTNSEVVFFSEAPLENIEAVNKSTKGVIDWSTGNFLFRVPIKEFVFDKSLMQTHFNENYLESDQFPNASFKGNIKGKYDVMKDGTYDVIASGELDIHGVVKKRDLPATIEVTKGKISINSKFIVELEDHDIDIPTIVFNKIAEEVEVTINAELLKL